MPNAAKAYIAIIGAAGLATLAIAGWQWSSQSLSRFALLLLLAMLASALKIRLPGFTGTVSASFAVILAGIAMFSLSETTLVGCAAGLAQSLWKSRRPKPAQLFFNVCCLTICSALAYSVSHFVADSLASSSLMALLALGGCFYLVLNTGLVSVVVALAERKPLRQVWQHCYEWVFPYFLVGGSVTGLAAGSGRSAGWTASLLPVPLMYLVYLFYRLHVSRATPAQTPAPAPEEELLLTGRRSR